MGLRYGAVANVAVAVSTLVPGGSVTLAVAVDDAKVPASIGLLNVLRVATPSVTTLTAITVPTGTLAAWRFTLMGFGVFGFSVVSGAKKKLACVDAGTVTPPMLTIFTLGKFVPGTTGPGIPFEGTEPEIARLSI